MREPDLRDRKTAMRMMGVNYVDAMSAAQSGTMILSALMADGLSLADARQVMVESATDLRAVLEGICESHGEMVEVMFVDLDEEGMPIFSVREGGDA